MAWLFRETLAPVYLECPISRDARDLRAADRRRKRRQVIHDPGGDIDYVPGRFSRNVVTAVNRYISEVGKSAYLGVGHGKLGVQGPIDIAERAESPGLL
jgi:hypothetical protein